MTIFFSVSADVFCFGGTVQGTSCMLRVSVISGLITDTVCSIALKRVYGMFSCG